MSNLNYEQIGGPHGALATRKPFVGNSMAAMWVCSREISPWGSGMLAYADGTAFYEACDRVERGWGDLYIVRSYKTPIAWAFANAYNDTPTYYVHDKFSPTTSHHQNVCKRWLDYYAGATVLT